MGLGVFRFCSSRVGNAESYAHVGQPTARYQMDIDRRLTRCSGVELIIRASGVYEGKMFRDRTKDVFPLMAKSGLVSFETSPSVNKCWGYFLVSILSPTCISTSW